MFSHHYCQDPISELLNDFLWLMQVQRGAKILYHSATYQEPSLTSCPSLVHATIDTIYDAACYCLSIRTYNYVAIGLASWTGPAHYTARRAIGWPAPTSISHRKRHTEWPCEVWRFQSLSSTIYAIRH